MGQAWSKLASGKKIFKKRKTYVDTSPPKFGNDFSTENDTRSETNTCNICMNQYMCLRIFDCSLWFCDNCIQKFMNVNITYCSILKNKCSTCSCGTNYIKSCYESSNLMPLDYAINDIREFKMLKGHKLTCEFCGDEGVATHKCINCREYYCSGCLRMHMRHLPLDKSHWIEAKLVKNSADDLHMSNDNLASSNSFPRLDDWKISQKLAKSDNYDVKYDDNNELGNSKRLSDFNPADFDPLSASSESSMYSAESTFTREYDVPTSSNWHVQRRRASSAPPNRYSRRTRLTLVAEIGDICNSLGQFQYPNGFCLSHTENIIIANYHSHCIQVFDKNGTQMTEFGRKGRSNGYLFHPTKVVLLSRNQIIVCDQSSYRSRLQIFTYPTGEFIKEIPLNFRELVTGLTVTANKNLVLVNEQSLVLVMDANNDFYLINSFYCDEYVKEPSDIIVKNNDYYVCDLKGHSVFVFDDYGTCLLRIGGNHISFPNGIDITENGEILVGYCYNNHFYVAYFSSDGTYLTDLKCFNIDMSRCCGLKTTSDGHIMTLDEDSQSVLVFCIKYE